MNDTVAQQEFPAFPKLYALGNMYVSRVLDGPVEVTEKVDGSQFAFGFINGELRVRSKGKEMPIDAPEKMFAAGVAEVISMAGDLPQDMIFYCEYLQRPKHNILAYNRVPDRHLALFGAYHMSAMQMLDHTQLTGFARSFGIDIVPRLHYGEVESIDQLHEFLNRESFLGGQKVEGVVIKNYAQRALSNGHTTRLVGAKFVSEAFKEKHVKNWSAEKTSRGRWETFKTQYCTAARWEKARARLQEQGQLEGAPRDIGALVKEVQRDVLEEERADILEVLWREFSGDLARTAIRGLPEWYKEQLAEGAFQ